MPYRPGCSSSRKKDKGYTDYWYNAALSWNQLRTGTTYKRATKAAALLYPSLTIMNGDGSGGSDHSRGSYRVNGCGIGGKDNTDFDPPFGGCLASKRANANGVGSGNNKHLEGQVYAFTDGHVKWYKGIPGATSNAPASDKVYDVTAGFDTSGQDPTFNAINQADVP